MLSRLPVTLLIAGFATSIASAADDKAGLDYFEKHIRPVLVSKCYKCHSASSKELGGNLLLDTREGTRMGGDSGKAVVPGNIDDSILLEAIRYEGLEMPPNEQMPAETIAKFEAWIRMGAADPRDEKSAPIRRTIDFEKAREFWSFQPLANPPSPKSKSDWARTDIDRFVLAKLEAKNLKPVADADPRVLVRRIYFDLIGLPPTLEQSDAFVAAVEKDRDAAIKALLDDLLSSQHFGERWGRHWLDVVRFGESTGMERNATYPYAWKFRDWVIRAYNSGKPFDQFIREQVAGDLLPSNSNEERHQNLIGTALLTLGPKSLNDNNKEKFAMDVVDEQIDVVSRAFIGLTASCARCHDHKFDPIPQKEYYGLAGIFRSTATHYGTAATNGNRNAGSLLSFKDGNVSIVKAKGNAKGKKQTANKQLKNAKGRLARFQQQIKKNPALENRLKKQVDKTKKQIAQYQKALKQQSEQQETANGGDLIMAVLDASDPADTQLRIRGEPGDRGDKIPRGFLTIGSNGHVPDIEKDGSGRLALAEWITQKDNPLTARVAVNRIWQHLFGRGIVATVDNFGANGDRPTHPELLDRLASDFVAGGWSVKNTIRAIVLSRTYQLGGSESVDAEAVDPDNYLLWRANHRRLEVEAIRDSILAASGQLDAEPAKGSVVQSVGDGIVGRNLQPSQFASNSRKRSVYLPIVRGAVPEILKVFDFPEPSMIAGRRDVTTVATQALYMMNSDFVISHSMDLAKRLLDEEDMEDAGRVELAYRLTLSRKPTQEEVDSSLSFVEETAESLGGEPGTLRTKDAMPTVKAWAGLAQALFASAEFRYVE